LPVQGPLPLSPGSSSPRLASVKILKSASTKISLVTNQELARGLFKRLDDVIAYPEEITNSRLIFGIKQAALQLLRARYG
jgi:hypothetical protein